MKTWLKLALGLGVLAGVAYAVQRAGRSASASVGELVTSVVDAVSPLNQNNVFATAANDTVSQIVGRPETLGGWIRSVTSDDDARVAAMLAGTDAPRNTGGATGSWDEPLTDLVDYRYF